MQMQSVAPGDHTSSFQWRPRLRAAAVHLLLSLLVAGIAALLVFVLWYPFPYRELSGGRDLFLLVVSVDVVIGPLVTLAVFDRRKPARLLRMDLAIIGVLQAVALGYGLWTVEVARPVHMVFEYDRFRVVHRVEIPVDLEVHAPPGIAIAPWNGPTLIALRQFRSDDENTTMTLQALQGVPLSARPELWAPYETQREQVIRASKPAAALLARFPQRRADIEAAVAATGRPIAQLRTLPLVARKEYAWTVLLDGADIVGYLPLDSF